MKIKLTSILFPILLISSCLFAQDCDCWKNIKLLQEKVEKDQASYQHQVIEHNRSNEYISFKGNINEKAKTISTKKDCIALTSYYLSFFQDEHSFIAYKEEYLPEPNPKYNSKPKRKSQNSLEGLWYFQDGSFNIEVIPMKTRFGVYVALIKDDRSKKWRNGQLKIEFLNDNENLKCIYWSQNLIPKTYNVSVTDSVLRIGRNLIFYRKKQLNHQSDSNLSNELSFTSLSVESNYLKIPSFDLSDKEKIDSLIETHRIEILSKKNLIIDIRNNSGGGFDAFKSILPFVLDNSIFESPYYGSVWVSENNFNYYDTTKYDFSENKQDSINEEQYISFLKEHKGNFTPIQKSYDSLTLESDFPLNVGILYNRKSASSTEGFILQSKSSKKVRTFGENSAGAVSYGDWIPFELPDLDIWVAITTKKMIFNSQVEFESIGIAPDVNLNHLNEKEWLITTLNLMEVEKLSGP